MSRLIVIVDMRGNNGRALGIVDESDQWLERFPSMLDVLALKERHPLGVFPWVVLDLDRPQANSVLL